MKPPRALARLSWALADQVVASGNNLLVVVLAAQALSPDDLGRFSVLVSVYLLTLLVTRGRVSEVLLLQTRARLDLGSPAAAVLAIGVLCAAVTAAALAVDPGTHVAVFAFGLPILALQDHLRLACFKQRKAHVAFASDSTWVVVQCAAFVVLVREGGTLVELTSAWVAGGVLGALVALRTGAEVPRDPRPWLRKNRTLGRALVADNLLAQGLSQACVVIVSVVAGLPEAAVLRIALTAFGPVAVIALAARSALLPELARVRDDPKVLEQSLRLLSGVLAAVAVAWSALLLVLPDDIGTRLFSPVWLAVAPLLVPLAVERFAAGLAVAPMLGLRLAQRSRRIVLVRVATLAVGLPAVVVGAELGGATEAAVALALGSVAGLVMWEAAWRRR